MRALIFLLISFQLQADWFLRAESPACLTLEALKHYEKSQHLELRPYQQLKVRNDCTIIPQDIPAMPQSIGVYSKAEMMSYEGDKVYFVVTRDLEKR